jgi:hypothetical protein
MDPVNPGLHHHSGTLREMHKLVQDLGEECPPINTISLPGNARNLYIPFQFGSLASHKVAQSRVPSRYQKIFNLADTKEHTEWSLIGGKGAISPFHVDAEGLGTVINIHFGSKYCVFATRIGECESLCLVNSLGASWDPYAVNDEDIAKHFHFEGVHLRQGDMV